MALVLGACGPVQSRATLVDAAAELSAARAAQAETHAPFELVAAEAYLEKAREEQSYADFETAVRFARKSRACAAEARKLSLNRAKASFSTSAEPGARSKACQPGPDRGPTAIDFDSEPAVVKETAPAPGVVTESRSPSENMSPAAPAADDRASEMPVETESSGAPPPVKEDALPLVGEETPNSEGTRGSR